MNNNQHTQEENQEDILARLAMISQAVEANLLSKQQAAPAQGTSAQEPEVIAAAACPIDPMERLLCESCQ